MRGFKITRNKGFHITFENGVTVSVQFGAGEYCQHHDDYFELIGKEHSRQLYESGDAEIAIWKEGGEWITKEFKDEGDDVLGWQSPEDVLKALNWAVNWGRNEQ